MSRQAQVGAFAIISLLLLFGIFYVITDFATRHTGYRIGVHFQGASGLTPGALVYFSGVNAGSVDSITLLPDNSVDVILAIDRNIDIPSASKFLIQAPVTGSPNVLIVPPRAKPPVAVLPRAVLPVDQQPKGTSAASISDLLAQGQGELKRFDVVMSEVQARTPKLLDSLQSTLDNANDLTMTARSSMQIMSERLLALSSSLQGDLSSAGANVNRLSETLNDTASRDSGKVDLLLDRLNSTSLALNQSMGALQSLATDPRLKTNVLATTQNIADATRNLSALVGDLRTVTGDPATQAQMRNTLANLDALSQRANSLLGELGGTSNVYGVDRNASPPPPTVPMSSPYPSPPSGEPLPSAQPHVSPQLRKKLQGTLSKIVHNLVALQLRFSGLSSQHAVGPNPVLTSDRGPQSDINAIVLPHGETSAMFGANDIGYHTTWNAALLQSVGDNVRIGGGVLYSQFGVLGQYTTTNRAFGLVTRLYDPRYPMLDLEGSFRVLPGARVFFGQRDITHATRRNEYGFQYTF